MWRDPNGTLNTGSWPDPAPVLGPALALVDDEALATGLERFAVEVEGMQNLLVAELLVEDWDPVEERDYEDGLLPPLVVTEAMSEDPDSVAELVVGVPLRWRLDVLLAVADRVEALAEVE
jgi:hypothetical protein